MISLDKVKDPESERDSGTDQSEEKFFAHHGTDRAFISAGHCAYECGVHARKRRDARDGQNRNDVIVGTDDTFWGEVCKSRDEREAEEENDYFP